MQWNKLKQCIGYRMRLSPIACRLDDLGQKLPDLDEDWLVSPGPTDETIQLSRIPGHAFPLSKDQVHHFTEDPIRSARGGAQYGMLTLLVQPYIQGLEMWVRPTLQPGVPLPPLAVTIEDRVVDFRYPSDSGLQTRLEANGYRIAWVLENRLSRLLDFEGWEIVHEKSAAGLTRYRVRDRYDDQVLVKKLVR
jgi:hypothetical protein